MGAWVSDSSSTLMCGRSGSMIANPAGVGLSKLVTFIGGSLSRVELDNDCGVKLGPYLRDVRLGDHPAGHGGGIHSQPIRNFLALQVSLHNLHKLSAPALGRPADLITYLYRTGGDIGHAAVQHDVAVAHDLPRLGARVAEAEPEDDVVQPLLQQADQRLARDAGPPHRIPVVATELALHEAVDKAGPLLLPQLERAVGDAPPAGVLLLAGWRGPALERALGRHATVALEVELVPVATAQSADRSGVTSHSPPIPFGAWAAGSRCAA